MSYAQSGTGDPLVLVHGSFSDQRTNWEFVGNFWERHFRTYALARRGRGLTTATENHELVDEVQDVVELISRLPSPVYLLGHSYGAHVALGVAAMVPEQLLGLIVYEPPRTDLITNETMGRLEQLASHGAWDDFAYRFFGEVLRVPQSELDELRSSELWQPIVDDAPASLQDLRALRRYRFDERKFAQLKLPVRVQTGSESPADLYVTAEVLQGVPDASLSTLEGQAHEGMTTAPEQYAADVKGFVEQVKMRSEAATALSELRR